jgi:L-lactate dehydrogenase complex protein LldG
MVENPIMSAARDAILQRIREALRDVPPNVPPEATAIARDYRQAEEGTAHSELVDRFIERVTEYRAVVRRTTAAAVTSAIAAACAERGARRCAVPADWPSEWAPEGIELVRDDALPNEQLDVVDGVLTACALAIAQTGTIVLDGGPRQGRRALSLVPDYHLCIVHADQIVGLVPEAVARLIAEGRATRPMTWISGPSATSDIELSRVEGVHGPRTLEVVVVA